MHDLNNILEKQKFDKNPQLEVLKAERDFYYGKLKDIDHILDVYKDINVTNLINNIRDIIYMVPEKIAIVCVDGNVKIKNRNDSTMQDDEINMISESSTSIISGNTTTKSLNYAKSNLNNNTTLAQTNDFSINAREDSMLIEDELAFVSNI